MNKKNKRCFATACVLLAGHFSTHVDGTNHALLSVAVRGSFFTGSVNGRGNMNRGAGISCEKLLFSCELSPNSG